MYSFVVRFLVGFLLIRGSTSGHPPEPFSAQNIDVPVSIMSNIFPFNNQTIANVLDDLLKDSCVFNITLTNETLNQKLTMKVTVNKETVLSSIEGIRLFELRKRRGISVEILFLFCGIFTFEIFHMVFLESFIRLARTRFQGNKRFKYYTNMTTVLTLLIIVINMMLIILFYRSIELYIQD